MHLRNRSILVFAFVILTVTSCGPGICTNENCQGNSAVFGTSGLDQTDDDGGSSGFGGGTQSNTQYVSSELQLTAAGMAGGSGVFTSRLMDAGASVNWTALQWVPTAPYGKPLLNNLNVESGYTQSNANMTNNVLLLHMEEASWAGVANEVVDSSSSNNHGVGLNGATTISTGRFLSGGVLDGINDVISVNSSASLSMTGAMSFEAWLKPSAAFNSASNLNQTIIDKGVYKLSLNAGSQNLVMTVSNSAAPSWTQVINTPVASDMTLGSTFFNGKIYFGTVDFGSYTTGDLYICNPLGGSFDYCESGDMTLVEINNSRRGVKSLQGYNGSLYIGFTSSQWDDEGDIYVCTSPTGDCDTPGEFTLSFDPGVGAQYVNAFANYKGKLYAATAGDASGEADIFVCDPGLTSVATTCETGDWTASFNGGTYFGAFAFAVFHDRLYAAVGSGGINGKADVFVCNPGVDNICQNGEWTLAYDGANNVNFNQVSSLGIFNDYLFVGVQGASATTASIAYCTPGADLECQTGEWTISISNGTNGAFAFDSVESLATYDGKLYAGTGWNLGLGEIWVCDPGADGDCDSADWSQSRASVGGADAVAFLDVQNGYLYSGNGNQNGDGDVYFLDSAKVAASSTVSMTAGQWNHVAATVTPGTNISLYVNGTNVGTTSIGAFTPATNQLPVKIGSAVGSTAFSYGQPNSFSGTLDEVAVFSRALSATEVSDHYKRGALRLKYQVRSCSAPCSSESFVGPDGTPSTFFSDSLATSSGLPAALTFSSLANNRYFQYQCTFETDSASLSPFLRQVTILPNH